MPRHLDVHFAHIEFPICETGLGDCALAIRQFTCTLPAIVLPTSLDGLFFFIVYSLRFPVLSGMEFLLSGAKLVQYGSSFSENTISFSIIICKGFCVIIVL